MYSEVHDKSEDLLAAAEDLLSENPNAVSGFLNDDDDEEEEDESAPFAMNSNPIAAANVNVNTLNPTMSNSLLERIQQQKNASSIASHTSHSSSFETPAVQEEEFGYPPVSENYTYATGPTSNTMTGSQSQQQPAGVHIPNYAAPQGPNPYDTSGSGSGGGDMMHQVLSAASNVASRDYYGTKNVMSGMMGALPSSSTRPEQGAANRMRSMDYQQESLLMDPHKMEEVGGIGQGGDGGGGEVRGFFGTSSSESNGLMGGGVETTAGA